MVKFTPALPNAYQQSIKNIGIGYADKLYASFATPFWGNKTGWLSFVAKTR
jgi:monoamine oxidase